MINNTTQFISNNQQPESKRMNQCAVPTPKKKQQGTKKYKNYKKTLQSRKPDLKTTILDNFYLEEGENVEKAKQVLMMASSHRGEEEDTQGNDAWVSTELDLERNVKIQGWKQEYSNQKMTSMYKNKQGPKQFRQKTITQFVNKVQQKSYLLNHKKVNSPYAKISHNQNKQPFHAPKDNKNNSKSVVKTNFVVINTTDSGNVREYRKLSSSTNLNGVVQTEYSGHIFKIKQRMQMKKNINSSNKQMMFDSRVFRQKYIPLHSFSRVDIDKKKSENHGEQNVKYRTSHAETGMFKHRHTKSENCQNSISKYIALTHTKKPIKIDTNQKDQNKLANLRRLYQLIHSFNYNSQDGKHSKKKLNKEYQRIYEKRWKSKQAETRTYCIKEMVSNFINKQNLQNSDEHGGKIGEILARNRRLSVRTVKQQQKIRSTNNSEKKLESSMYNLQQQQIPTRIQIHQTHERHNTIG